MIPPARGKTLTFITVTFKNDKCVLDLNLADIPVNAGEIHYWSLVQAGPPRPLPVTFDSNGIDISQGIPPFLYDFIDPMYSGNTYQWTANPKFSTGWRRSYTVHATWTKPDATKVACVSTDPWIVNRGSASTE